MFRIIKTFLRPFYHSFKKIKRQYPLIKANPTLQVDDNVEIRNASFGRYNYLASNVKFFNSSIDDYSYIADDSKMRNVHIAKFTCIGPRVLAGLGEHPTRKFVSIHPVFYSTMAQAGTTFVDQDYFDEYPGQIIIGNDVWIGARVLLMNNITIGDGAIVASGSVVTKDVAPYAIVAGVPAKLLKYRFDKEIRKKLLQEEWWNKDEAYLKQHKDKFHDINHFFED